MSRRLLLLNAISLMAGVGAAGYIVLALTEPDPKPILVRPRPSVATAATTPARSEPATGAASYSVVASRNLFSPMRTEATAAGGALGTAVALPKPNLHGVVLVQGASVAYLEDPATRRVAAYRLGDSIAGGTIQAIDADHVVLSRPEGRVDVRLHDPSKPRPPAPASAGTPQGQPGQLGVPPQPVPFQVPGIPVPQPQAAVPQGPLIEQPGSGSPLPRRPLLPPNLIRRVPPSASSDAPAH
jgi:hypothetical protein